MANLKNTSINDAQFRLPIGDTAARPASPSGREIRFNTETGKLEQFRPGAGAWVAPSNTGVIATGGDSVYDVDVEGNTYRVHVFTSTGTSTFEVLQGGEVEYLIVAGGGGGAGDQVSALRSGGGGGAGGLLTGTAVTAAQNHTVTVGNGGAGGTGNGEGSNGNNSDLFGNNAIGGGGGTYSGTGNNGGSGGGGGGSGTTPGSGTAGQGNDGGSGYRDGSNYAGGGGGGAGSQGESIGAGESGGNGGIGITSRITGTSVFYAGGGGGGTGESYSGQGLGGLGGGGNGAVTGGTGFDATPNTGGGGGGSGGRGGSSNARGGAGGDGIVIIRYPLRQENPVTAPGKVVGNGLVLDLDFAKPTVYSGSGTVVTDSRLTGVEGDLVNGPEFVNPRTHRSAFDFNGSNELIDTNEPTANLFRRTGSGSVVMWFKTSSTSRMTLVSGYPGSGTNRWDFEIENLRLSGIFHNSGFISGNIDIDSDVWTMASFSYDSSQSLLSFYVNDQFDNSQNTSSQSLESNADLGIACRSDNSNFNFDGQIAIVKIFERTLILEEIQTIYDYTRWRFGV